MLQNLNITDTPVGSSPPVGPSVSFSLSYNSKESYQPQNFYYSNLGPNWTFTWLSYIQDDPANPAADVSRYVSGGGVENSTGYNATTQTYAPQYDSHAIIVRTSTSPIRYQRQLGDGSVEVFAQADGALTFPRKVFMTSRQDAAGNTLTFTYDSSLRLVAATDAIGQVTSIAYQNGADPLKITSVTDPFGRSAQFQYNSLGLLTSITDVIGITSSFSYEANDFISAMTTPYGTTRFTLGSYGSSNQNPWIQATDPLGGTERLVFITGWFLGGTSGLPVNVIPATEPAAKVPPGFATYNTGLNAAASVYFSKRAMSLSGGNDFTMGKITTWLFEPFLLQVSTTKHSEVVPLENRVWYGYPGQPPVQIALVTQQPFVVIGSSNQPSTVARVLDDGSAQAYRYEYNSLGNVTRVTDPLGRTTFYRYDTNGVDLLQARQVSGQKSDLLASYTYNSQHKPLTVTSTSGQTMTYAYNARGQLLSMTTPPRAGITENRTTAYAYDTNGYLQSVTGPAPGATTTYTYDGYGRVRTVTNSDNYTLTYDYDALDRTTKVTYPDGTYEQTVYNFLDAQDQRDRLGRWTHTYYDSLRRVALVRDALGQSTTYQWCSCGSLDAIIDGNGNQTSWSRDVQGRVTRETRADNAQFQYTYENTTSRLLLTTDALNQVKGYQYFVDNSLKQITYTNAVNATPSVSYTYDPIYSRVATMTDGTGTTTYTYNSVTNPPALGAGQLASVSTTALTNATVTYAYDELGRVTSHGLSAFTVTNSYDALGRLTTEANPVGTFTLAYDGVTGRPLTITYPNNQVTQYAYFSNTGDRRLQQITNLNPSSATISQYAYSYDAVGNISTWSQQLGSSTPKVYAFGYDADNELKTAQVTGPTPLPVPSRYGYAYDAAGNQTGVQLDDSPAAASYNNRNELTQQQGGVGPLLFQGTVNKPATVSVQGQPSTVSPSNAFTGQAQVPTGTSTVVVTATDPSGNTRTNTYQVTVSGSTTTYTYDLNGNQKSKVSGGVTTSYDWDAANRLLDVKQGATTLASFVYDGSGRRFQKIAGGVTHSYIYDGANVSEERLSSGQTYDYVQGPGIDRPLAMRDQASVVSYYLADHLGSIVQMTNSTGAVTLSRDYDPFGNPLVGAATAGYAFTGREWDPETNLYYYRARYYDPKQGRFLNEDPIGFGGGVNFYAYVGDNPVNWTDPDGLFVPPPGGPWLANPYVAIGWGTAWAWYGAWEVGNLIADRLYPPPGPPAGPGPGPASAAGTQMQPQPTSSPTPTTTTTTTTTPPTTTTTTTCPEDPCKKIRMECEATCRIVAASKHQLVRQKAFEECMRNCVRLRGYKWGCTWP
jgi:RHS repeat-associated protein